MWRKLALTLLTGLTVSSARASSIIPSFSSDGNDCWNGAVAPFTPFVFYIGAVLGGDQFAAGMTGAEFRLTGVDTAWFTTVTPNPLASLSIGNPVTTGCSIAFATCQTGSFVLLYTIQSLALAPITPRVLEVVAHSTPSNPNFICPLLTNCSAPVFGKECVQGGQAGLNTPFCPCCPAVESSTWSRVKSLYNSGAANGG